MKINKINFLLLLLTILLTGCIEKNYKNDIDLNKFIQVQSANTLEEKIIKEYIAVPIYGQLRPLPHETNKKNLEGNKSFLTKEMAVAEAKKNAQEFPDQDKFFNAIMTYNYIPGSIYTIYSAPLNITDIVFEKGEKIISQAAGDTLRWQIASTYSGENENSNWHIIIKPQKLNIATSMIITTNKRTYHLILKSVNPDESMVAVKWQYADNMLKKFNNTKNTNIFNNSNIDLTKINFSYTWNIIKGEKPHWNPEQIFNLNHQTFIKFPNHMIINNMSIPMLFIKEDNNINFNWRIKNGYMIIDGVIENAYLKSDINNQNETIIAIKQKG